MNFGEVSRFFEFDRSGLELVAYSSMFFLFAYQLESKLFPKNFRKYFNWLIVVGTCSLILFLYWNLYLRIYYDGLLNPPEHRSDRTMAEIFRDYLLPTLWYNIYKPPLVSVFPALVAKLFSPTSILYYKLFNFMNIAINFVGCLATFKTLLLVTRSHVLSACLTILYSLVAISFLLGFDSPTHWDSLTLPLISIFFCAIIFLIHYPSKWAALGASIAAIAMYGYSSIGLVIYALSVPLLAFHFFQMNAKSCAWLYIALPCVVAGVWLTKNYVVNGNFSPSMAGGGNQIRALIHTGNGRELQEFVDSTAPEWYRTCYSTPVPPPKTTEVWKELSRAFGICFPWAKALKRDSSAYINSPQPWPFLMADFYERIAALPDVPPKILHALEQDLEVMQTKKYVFAGSLENSGFWQAHYAQQSTKIFKAFVMAHPQLFLRTVARIHNRFFFVKATFISLVELARTTIFSTC